MPKTKNRDNNEPSLDSFLDIVTNLVGILIILIMVVGITARDAMVQAAVKDVNQTEQVELIPPTLPPQITLPQETVSDADLMGLKMEVLRIQSQTQEINKVLSQRFDERNQLQLLLTSAQTAMEQKTQELGKEGQSKFDKKRDILEKTEELDDLFESLESLEQYEPETVKLKHYPTPMAETVFGNEEHFRLQNGRLTYVPMNRLVAMLKSDATKKASQLRNSKTLTATVGPVGDFYCRYTLRRAHYTIDTSMGAARREAVDLDNFVLVPVSDNIGEPFEQAIQPGSTFSDFLAEFDPSRTTVTIWTYPNSFGEFRQLKEIMYQKGFATAGRPLPEGFPIGGSPRGQRSAAQ